MTYIGANLREPDAREILCQLPPGTTGGMMAAAVYASIDPAWTWVASLDGQPACVFGFQPLSVPVWQGWAWGTNRMIRAIPAVTRHCLSQQGRLLKAGVRRLEVRTIKSHDVSQAWLSRLGCRHRCDLPDHGTGGETFELWAWHLSDGLPTNNTSYRNRRNVPEDESAQGASTTEASVAAVEARG